MTTVIPKFFPYQKVIVNNLKSGKRVGEEGIVVGIRVKDGDKMITYSDNEIVYELAFWNTEIEKYIWDRFDCFNEKELCGVLEQGEKNMSKWGFYIVIERFGGREHIGIELDPDDGAALLFEHTDEAEQYCKENCQDGIVVEI